MQLTVEFSRLDHCDELRCGRQFNTKPGFRREVIDTVFGLQEIGMDPVAEASGAWRRRSQRVDGSRGISGLLEQLALTAYHRILAGFCKTSGQFEGKGLERRPILPYQRKPAVGCERNDGEIVELANRMIGLRRCVRREFHLPSNDVDPGRYGAGLPGFDLR